MSSALRPVTQPISIPVHIADCMTEWESSWESADDTGADKYALQNPYIAQTFSQAELSDLIRDLDQPKSRQNF